MVHTLEGIRENKEDTYRTFSNQDTKYNRPQFEQAYVMTSTVSQTGNALFFSRSVSARL